MTWCSIKAQIIISNADSSCFELHLFNSNQKNETENKSIPLFCRHVFKFNGNILTVI
jgi:hypothetical protein